MSQIEFSQTILEDIGEKIKQILVDGAGKWVKSEENDIFLGDAMHIWRFAWQTIFPKKIMFADNLRFSVCLSIPHIVRSGGREQNAYNKRMRTQSEHRLCPQRGGQLTSLTVNIKHS